MIGRIVLISVILILSLSAPVLAAEPGNGKIGGQLVNGTTGGSSVADQTVTLTTYLNDKESGTSTAKADAEGRFVFNGLSTASGYAYEVKVTYQEADYTGERLKFANGETTKSTRLTVYDSTGSDEAVKISAAHTIVYLAEGGLEVVEYLVFANESDRSYIGSGEITTTGTRRTLKLPLPAKATELQYGDQLMSCCILQDANGLTDTMAVLPGEKLIAYSYKVSYSGGAYKFSRKVDYPIASYSFLVQGGEAIQLTSNRLAPAGPMQIEGNTFNTLSGGSLAAGDTLEVQVAGLPKSANMQTIIWVLGAMVVLGVAGGLAYLRKKQTLRPVRIAESADRMRQRLLLELAGLDDDFESGKIEKETYRKLRAEKKAQLVELMQGLKEESR